MESSQIVRCKRIGVKRNKDEIYCDSKRGESYLSSFHYSFKTEFLLHRFHSIRLISFPFKKYVGLCYIFSSERKKFIPTFLFNLFSRSLVCCFIDNVCPYTGKKNEIFLTNFWGWNRENDTNFMGGGVKEERFIPQLYCDVASY